MRNVKVVIRQKLIELLGLETTYRLAESSPVSAVRWLVERLLLPIQILGNFVQADKKIFLVAPSVSVTQMDEFKKRLGFYLPDSPIEKVDVAERVTIRSICNLHPLLFLGQTNSINNLLLTIRKGSFDVDYDRNHTEGWAWCHLTQYASRNKSNIQEARDRLDQRVGQLNALALQKSYVFGTGPSLEKSIDHDWSDGYRIVCNTVVRDPELWNHLNPHFIVAGDPIYHYGFTQFASAFRKDLYHRMAETDTYFVYPFVFDQIIRREFVNFLDRLIPIPMGRHLQVHVDLRERFQLPVLGNVLPLLLLPLACTLSKDVNLWGFDGRAPDDKLFWSNSNKHSYPELMYTLQEAHPAFFNYHLSSKDKNRYVKTFHGDLLDRLLQNAESEGWYFKILHESWTPTLQKRYAELR